MGHDLLSEGETKIDKLRYVLAERLELRYKVRLHSSSVSDKISQPPGKLPIEGMSLEPRCELMTTDLVRTFVALH